MPTSEELKMLQALTLDLKLRRTKQRIREWVDYYGEDGIYISFSGGKDSTVLLDIVRNKMGYKRIPFVFVNTGLEYPEIVQFVMKNKTDIDYIIRPAMNFKSVVMKYGYPFIGKEVSEMVYEAKNRLRKTAQDAGWEGSLFDLAKSIEFKEMNLKTAQLLGISDRWKLDVRGNEIKHNRPSMYDKKKWAFMLDAPFDIGANCCKVMKKTPVHKFAKETGRVAITAQTAEESNLRKTQWMNYGCNAFNKENPISNPMSFWTEQDILQYIKQNDIEICSVYGEIVAVDKDGFEYFGDFPCGKLKTTRLSRTGCMFCGYGCHLRKPGEGPFELMKQSHPKQYDYIMRPLDQGGLNYKEIIDWMNENGGLNIRY